MSRCLLGMRDGKFIAVAGPRDTDLMRQVATLKHSSKTGEWSGPARWNTCLQLRALFGEDLTLSDEVYSWGDRQVYRENYIHALKDGRYRPLHEEQAAEWSDQLMGFQLDSVPQMADIGLVANCDVMGAGKTVQVARAMRKLYMEEQDVLPALVICTNSMQDKWAEELEKWFPECDPIVVRGTAAKRRKLIEDAHQTTGSAPVLIITWGSLRGHTRLAGYGSIALKRCRDCDPKVGDPDLKVTSCETHPGELNGGWIRTVIADEAHKAINPKAKQTRALWAVGREAHNRYPMTGTPVRNTPEDFWSILHFTDHEAWPSRSKFIDRYCHAFQGQWGFEVVGYNLETKPELDRLVAPHFICRPRSVIQPYLPPVVPVVRWAHMEGKQKKAYETFGKDQIARLDSGILVATDQLSVNTRLRQLACASLVMDDDGRVVGMEEPSCKVAAFMDILEERGDEPIVAFSESKLLIDLVAARLEKEKVSCATIAGDVDNWTRKDNVDRFQRGELGVILVSLGAGAEGITLTRSSIAVFLQRSWNMVSNTQAEARVIRHGQEAESVTIMDIITKDTIEEAVFETAQDKEEVLQQIVKDPAWLRRAIKGET